MNDSKKDKDKLSIPIYFKSSKDLYIGKGSFKINKSSLKFTDVEQQPKIKTQSSGNTSSKYNVKEFTLISRDKSKKDFIYKGREAPQDSNYILMKYNSDNRSIQICPANKWINFIQSFNYNEQKIEDKEKDKKKKMKEKYKNFKEIFNFDYIDEMKNDPKDKKKARKKKTLLPTSQDEDIDDDDKNDDDDSLPKKKKKKNTYDFEEDSHSSELSLDLKEDSYESEEERRKEEKKLREEEEKRKKEEEKRKEKEKNQSDKDDEFDDFDDFDDKSFEDAPSDVDENEDNNEIFDLLSKKRNREKYPYDNMREELVNLFRKKNKRTYEEIMIELIKKFNKELVQQYIEQLLDENTSKFCEGDESYYFLK